MVSNLKASNLRGVQNPEGLKLTLLLLFFAFSVAGFSQAGILSKRISIEFNSQSVTKVIKQVAEKEKINFIYSKNVIETKKLINRKFVNKSVREILEFVIKNTDLLFIEYEDAIMVFKEKKSDFFFIELKILDEETGEIIPYSAAQKLNEFDAKIANHKGLMTVKVDENLREAQLVFSSMSYLNDTVLMDSILKYGVETISLRRKPYKIEAVNVKEKTWKTKKVGNKFGLALGALYLDTHGQQTAYRLENKKQKKAILSKVSVFLSPKGNVNAPFRLRIYGFNAEQNKPGKEILQEVLVFRPREKGWFTMDVLKYEIEFPKEGLLVAIQGIYTDEFEKTEFEYTQTDKEQGSFEVTPQTVAYGQRLGFTKFRGKNTWHFSQYHSWYQMKKRNYDVMISAKVLY